MRFCAYMTFCLILPFALLAEDEGKAATESAPEEEADVDEVAVDPGFERFKSILDRMPFGRPPPGFNPDAPSGPVEGRRGAGDAAEAMAEAEAGVVEQQILSSVRVSVLNVTPAGKVVVGFTDSSVQPARNYLLEVGEKRGDCEWLVVDADPGSRQVKLSKGGVEATLRLGGGSGVSEAKKEDEDGGKVAARPGPARGRPHHPRAPGAGAAGGEEAKMTGLEIARARREERRAAAEEEAAQQRQAAEQAKKEREQAAEERKAQLAQLMQIQEELRRQREEKLAEQERRAAEEEASPQGAAQETVED